MAVGRRPVLVMSSILLIALIAGVLTDVALPAFFCEVGRIPFAGARERTCAFLSSPVP
jgi:hypothetical protein